MKRSEIPVILLAGGFGTRISEETENKPKPMVLIGKRPVLWHVMSIYAAQGFRKFLIATGYKHEVIDTWVAQNSKHNTWGFDCDVHAIFTGDDTQTGGRIKQIINANASSLYMLTYGDGVGNIDLNGLLDFHLRHGKCATVTSVRPPARFGVITNENGLVTHFGEKNQADAGWINGGFFVVNKEIAQYIDDYSEPFEKQPLSRLVSQKELMTFEHKGFWQPMDTLREKQILEGYTKSNSLPWLQF